MKTNPFSETARITVSALCVIGGLALSLLAIGPAGTRAQLPAGIVPTVTKPVKADLSPALRDISPKPVTGQIADTDLYMPKHFLKIPFQSDPVLQGPRAVNTPMPAAIQNFEGIDGDPNGFPVPDTNGDVGPNHYVQFVNAEFAVFDKAGNKLYPASGAAAGNTLWSGFGGACETQNDGDPIVKYDHLADRWFFSQLAIFGGGGVFHQCVAISQTPDPTGPYYRYDFSYSFINDYPKFGVWPDGYYATYNLFNSDSTFHGAGVAVFERDKMLRGDPTARQVFFDLSSANPNFGGMLPADLDGPPPPSGSPGYFTEVDTAASIPPNDAMRIWEFHVDWTDPTKSTFGVSGQPNQVLNVAHFTPICSSSQGGECIKQPTGPALAGLGDVLMYRLAYRNFSDHQSLVVNHTVDTDGTDHAGVRWYEVRRTGGLWSIYQQGTYAGDLMADVDNRWMGSVAMDRMGNMALGYSVASSITFPSIRYAGRLATDPPGSLAQSETSLISGFASDRQISRWGDYSMMGVDPTDDCTFWYTQEYDGTNNFSVNFQTRIGSFKFPSCVPSSKGSLQGRVTSNSNGQPIASASVTAGGYTAITNATGFYQFTLLPPGTYTVTASAAGYNSSSASGVSVSDGGTTTRDFSLGPAPTPTPTPTATTTPTVPPTPTPTPTATSTPQPTPTPTPTITPTPTPVPCGSDDTWTATSIINAPDGRIRHSAVWTGREMIVWGGEDENGNNLNTGGRYNPSADTWNATSTTDAPDPRMNHTAVWTGREMIVWGGLNSVGYTAYNLSNTGGRYNPVNDSWSAISSTNAPTARQYHTAVWTGTEMIVWGGDDNRNLYTAHPVNTGARYNPSTDRWTPMSTTNAPDPRRFHTAVWTGTEMIVWGGDDSPDDPGQYTSRGPHPMNTGGRYNPITDTWTSISSINAPDPRLYHTAVWTGTEMIVWGGFISDGTDVNTGAKYNPSTDAWTPISTTNAPDGRQFQTGVWTGTEMIVWGGGQSFDGENTGGRYNPSTNTWTITSTTAAPAPRIFATAIWSGSQMIAWGGTETDNGSTIVNTGGTYCAVATTPSVLLHFHGNPTDDRGCTGVGADDVTVCGGPFLLQNTLGMGAPGHWDVPTPGVHGTGGQNARDPNWIWNLAGPGNIGPSRISGDMSINWWASCAGCGTDVGNADWDISLWVDGALTPAFVERVTATPDLPNVPRLLTTTVTVPPLTVNASFVIQIDPVSPTTQANTHIYYDSQSPCPGATGSDPCDSSVIIPLLPAPTPAPTPTPPPTPTPSPTRIPRPASCTADTWTATTTMNALDGRRDHSAVWTGTEMLVWGGFAPDNNGGRYNPLTDSWTSMSTTNAPEARDHQTAVWTGTEMIVWGGLRYLDDGSSVVVNTGGRYNPSTDTWTATSTINAPSPRYFHTAVWTGSEMIVWGGLVAGGLDQSSVTATGAKYNPATDTWTPLSTTNAPDARWAPTAVWTGSEMIVWGGIVRTSGGSYTYFNTGGRYNPTTDSWIATSTVNAPDGRYTHTAVWTGSDMIVWGGTGLSSSGLGFDTGGRYNPASDSWIATDTASAPQGRGLHTAVWTGNEMIAWGGVDGGDGGLALNTGGSYDPNTDSWSAINATSAPEGRASHTAVWTGSQMIIWGGVNNRPYIVNTGGIYCITTSSPWVALHFHGNPTDDASCTGVGPADLAACGGPFLLERSNLGTGNPAHWDSVAPGTDGSGGQNSVDPNWVWNLTSPVTIKGPLTVNWWATCSVCTGLQWDIRLWVDGGAAPVFVQRVNATFDQPFSAGLLSATVNVPAITANSSIVLQVDPVSNDPSETTTIYYDSQSVCPGQGADAPPCDSTVIMPVAPAVTVNRVVSRKTHGTVGTFDVDLTSGNGIECRSGGANGNYTIVFIFANPLFEVDGASVTSGTGSVASSSIDPSDPHNYIVNLAGVNNAQTIRVGLTNVTDSVDEFSSAISATMGVLLGDVNATRRVDAADVSAVRQQTLQPITSSNFRADVNASGRIDAADVSVVRQQTLTSLP